MENPRKAIKGRALY